MKRVSKLGLGTVQWGTTYGVANRQGMTPAAEVGRILSAARRAAVSVLDTAALYGEAESALGVHDLTDFRIVTKTPRFATTSITETQADELLNTFHCSLEKLGVDAVYGLLVHHTDDLLAPGGSRLVEALRSLQAAGKVARVGVSIYDRMQLDAVFQVFSPEIVQLPVSVLDQRLIVDGSLTLLHSRGVEIHTRSVFLQGLLLMMPSDLPTYFAPVRPLLQRWHDSCAEQALTPVQAALAFVRDIAEIDYCLVGVQSLAQFEDCVRDFGLAQRFDATGLACNDPAYVNPANWRLA